MPILKGRATTPIRPGLVAKHVLTGKLPLLPAGEIVSESSIVDLHRTYKELIKMENMSRPRARRLKGMTYRSYLTLFKFAQLLNLVTFVREEPMQFPPPGGNLYSIRKPDGIETVISARRIFKISPVGADDEKSWMNLCRAWRESWPAPQKIEYLPPYVPPPEKVVPPVEVEKKPWVPFKRTTRATARQIGLLHKHLERLIDAGITAPGVDYEVERLASMMVDWSVESEDAISRAEKAKKPKTVKYQKELKDLCDKAEVALIAKNLNEVQKIVTKIKELKERK